MKDITGLDGAPREAFVPAEAASQRSPQAETAFLNSASATGLRVTLAVQTKRTLRGAGALE